MILSQLAQLLSVPPGDLVYHLVVLFAIEAILMMAIGEGRRSSWEGRSLRLALAAGGLLIARCVLVIVALLSAADVTNSAWIAPPLERLVAVISLGLLAWAFLPLMDDYPQAGLVLVVVNLVGAVILYASLAPQWYEELQRGGASYNATLADGVWNVWAAALALLALAAAVIRRRAQWGILAATFGLLLLGHLFHLLMAETQTHIAGWVRLAELSAYPLLAGLMIQRTVEREEPAPPSATALPWTVIQVCQRVADAPNMNVALQRAGVTISNILNTDVLAIGLLSEAGDTVELAAVCRASSPARSGPAFDLDSQLSIQSAVSRQRSMVVGADQEAQRATLAALVGGAVGSLWVQPLVHQRTTVGVLIVSRSHPASGWTTSETQTLNGLCGVLASALSAARKTAALTRQVDDLAQMIRDRDATLAQAQAEAQRRNTLLKPNTHAPTRQAQAVRPAPPPSSGQSPLLFFDQTARHLQRLDDLNSRLVAHADDRDALLESCQIADSLNEMSARMGYNTFARLAGALSGALRPARDGKQQVTSDLLALVGESALALQTLLADAKAMRSPSLDSASLTARLAALSAPPLSPQASDWESTRKTPPPGRTLIVRVKLDRTTPLKAARAMMVLAQIKRLGQIVACQPVEADLRSGGFDDEFSVTFATSSAPEAVHAALAAIRDVTSVDIRSSAA